jgi:hypothetical protein
MLGPKHEDGVLDRLGRRVGATMRAPAAIYESFCSGLVIAIDPAVGRWARDPIRAAQVRYRHLFLLVTGQKLQTLIQDTTLFPGHTTSSCCPNAEEPSPSRFAVTHVSGLFCNGSAKYAQGRCPIARRKGSPQSSALRFALSVPPVAPSPRVGDSPSPCALLPPPSPGGVRHVGTCHAWHEKQRPGPRRKHHEDPHQHRHPH